MRIIDEIGAQAYAIDEIVFNCYQQNFQTEIASFMNRLIRRPLVNIQGPLSNRFA